MNRQAIATTNAPAAVGPYSQAIAAGDLLFCSGQVHLDPAGGTLVEGDIATQTARVLDNLDGRPGGSRPVDGRRPQDDRLPRRHQRLRGR